MSTWTIKLYASDMPDDPANASADEGEYDFNVLSLFPVEEAFGDIIRKADGTLDNSIPQIVKFKVEFLPFYIKTSIAAGQQNWDDLLLLKKMLRQPYLVIKSCTLPVWSSGPNNLTAEYPLPAIVRWNYDEGESLNKDDGIIEYNIELELLYKKGQTQPVATTSVRTYAY